MATETPTHPFPDNARNPTQVPHHWSRLSDLITAGAYVADSEEKLPAMAFIIHCRSAGVVAVAGADGVVLPHPFDAKEEWIGQFTEIDHSATTVTEADIWIAFHS